MTAARRSDKGLREVIRDYRREQVLDVARRLLSDRRSTEVSMDEIAAAAGVARSTLYVYFSGREELLRACLRQLAEQLDADLREAWALESGTTARLAAVVRGLLTRVDDGPAFFAMVLAIQSSEGRESAAVGAELASIGLSVAGTISELVERGIAEGLFRPMPPDRAATLVGQQLLGAMSVRAGDPAPRPLEEEVVDIVDFLDHALAVRGLGAETPMGDVNSDVGGGQARRD